MVPWISAALHAALQADTAAVTQQALLDGVKGPAIGQRVHQARVEAVARSLVDRDQALALAPDGATVGSSTATGLPVR